MDKKIIENIISVLNKFPNKLGAVSTISEDGMPHSAVVYYTYDENLNIYFATRVSTRKYKDCLCNPHVAFLASEEHSPRTVQIEGSAKVVIDPEEQRTFFSKILDTANKSYPLPPFAQMMNAELELIKITPVWARLGDFDVLSESEMFQETSF